MKHLALAILVCCLLQALGSACVSGPGNPEEEYRAAMEALYEGSLLTFYQRLVPPSYEQDLNTLLDEARQLIGEREFQQALQIWNSFSHKVAAQIESQPQQQQSPAARLLAQSIRSIPEQLGLASYRQFQQASVRSILQSLEQGALGKALKHPSVPVSWSRQQVELIEQSGEHARLRVTSAEGPASQAEEKTVELVLVEGKWIPLTLASQWEQRIDQIRDILDSWKSQKEKDPEFVSRRLTALGQQLDLLVLLVPSLLESLVGREAGE